MLFELHTKTNSSILYIFNLCILSHRVNYLSTCSVMHESYFNPQLGAQQVLQHVVGYDEFDVGYSKTTNLHFIRNWYDQSQSRFINLVLDEECHEKFHTQNDLSTIQLRQMGPYFVCEHVVYCLFSCQHKHFFKKASGTVDDPGTSLFGFKCPFNDAGVAQPQQMLPTVVTLRFQTLQRD